MINPLAYTIVGVLFASLFSVFRLLTDSTGDIYLFRTFLFCAALFVIAMALVVWSVFSRNGLLFDLFIFYFFAISIAFAGLYQIAAWRFPWPIVHDSELLETTIALYLLSLLFLFAGRIFPRTKIPRQVPEANRSSLGQFATALLALSILLLFSTNPLQLFSSRSGVAELVAEGGLAQLSQVGKSACLTSALLFISLSRSSASQPNKFLLWGSVILALLWYNPVSSPRFQFIGCVVSLVVCKLGITRLGSAGKATVLLAMFVANYLFFGVLKSLSDGIENLRHAHPGDWSEEVKEYAFRVDFDSFQVSANAVTAVGDVGFAGLRNIAGTVFFFVPRSVWPEKPYPSSIELMSVFSYDYLNLSFPLPMEFYYSGGLLALVGLSFLSGLLLRNFAFRLQNDANEGGALLRVGISLLCGFLPIILRGSIVAVISMFGFCYVFLLLYSFARKVRGFLLH